MVRHWSPWDSQLLRVLRGEFRLEARTLTFRPGPQGGRELAAGRDIGAEAQAAQVGDDRQGGIGLHGVGDQRFPIGEGVSEDLVMTAQGGV